MVKKIIAGVLIAAIVALAAWKLFFDKSDVGDKLDQINQNLVAYHMEATMDLLNDEETRSYFVTTDYNKKNEQDYFRISLLDKNINQEQILLRNQNGVYVLTPMLNQVYQFKGNYPLNSPKPYLYHSLLEVFNGDHEVQNLEDGYLISSTPSYENAPEWVKQDIKLSSDLKPVWVNIYNANNEIVVKVTFSKVDLEPTYTDTYFDVSENMKQSRENISSTSTINEEDLPLIPSNGEVYGTLKEQTQATVNGKTVFILTYDGDKPFTVVQSILQDSEEISLKEVSGNIIEFAYGVGYVNGYNLTYLYNGVSIDIYSETLSVNEMISIANSMDIITGTK